ncbi:hypothetical protein LH128_01042 [Sphingomonas sp. LH128]|uniref:hypothetical protein n=1 Tax=Sphingomonas sp. LH128 TaxID=473781 RepID=UPI00027CC1E8|nr:hypothetical protein [Sphingomonas sp. LH128]EJU14976.1 hypothetical protein LH128_01042 [Sphingomonas sp. LH128]
MSNVTCTFCVDQSLKEAFVIMAEKQGVTAVEILQGLMRRTLMNTVRLMRMRIGRFSRSSTQ